MRVISNHEDSAGNLVHLLLIIFAITICLTHKKLRRQRYIIIYGLTVTSLFLLFCFLLRWQPFHSRLQLPGFVLFSAFVGVVLSKPNIKTANFIAIFLILTAISWSLFNSSRPLIFSMDRQEYVKNGSIVFKSQNLWNTSSIEQYFNNRPELEYPYVEAVNLLRSKGCSNIGLSNVVNWEYPFWVLLQKDNKQAVHIEHVNVKNISHKIANMYPYNNFNPCAIIYASFFGEDKDRQLEEIVTQKGNYVREWSRTPISVFVKR